MWIFEIIFVVPKHSVQEAAPFGWPQYVKNLIAPPDPDVVGNSFASRYSSESPLLCGCVKFLHGDQHNMFPHIGGHWAAFGPATFRAHGSAHSCSETLLGCYGSTCPTPPPSTQKTPKLDVTWAFREKACCHAALHSVVAAVGRFWVPQQEAPNATWVREWEHAHISSWLHWVLQTLPAVGGGKFAYIFSEKKTIVKHLVSADPRISYRQHWRSASCAPLWPLALFIQMIAAELHFSPTCVCQTVRVRNPQNLGARVLGTNDLIR